MSPSLVVPRVIVHGEQGIMALMYTGSAEQVEPCSSGVGIQVEASYTKMHTTTA